MTISFRILIFCYCLLTNISLASRRICYQCLVQEKCLTLNKNAENATRECPAGVEHCVVSHTKSKVTGAVAVDYMCGGRVYDVNMKPKMKDGCFEGVEEPGARTKRTLCYCSSDLCNHASMPTASIFSICLISMPLIFIFS